MFAPIMSHQKRPAGQEALLLLLIASVLASAGCARLVKRSSEGFERASVFVSITNFSQWVQINGENAGEEILTSPELAAPFDVDEIIVSWNADSPQGTGLKIQTRALYPEHTTEFYTLGLWASNTFTRPRESVVSQKDEDGDVATDTLVLRRESKRAQIRITLLAGENGKRPSLKFVGVCFSRGGSGPAHTTRPMLTLDRVALVVPERAQLSYSDGRDWCSPSCVSMALSYWAEVTKRPDLRVDVPEVAAGVYDRNWPGTGNWPFNTAFAGQLRGMRGFVTRLGEISELEELIKAGVPPILSVSFDLLNDGQSDRGGGHLVTCVAFDQQGNPVLNDPWASGSKDGTVRRTVSRSTLARAWARSRNTVYLIFPEIWPLPASAQCHW